MWTSHAGGARKLPPGFLAVRFGEIAEPGVYVTPRGELFRIPHASLSPGHSPLLSWNGNGSGLVFRISADPDLALLRCRFIAANANLPVGF